MTHRCILRAAIAASVMAVSGAVPVAADNTMGIRITEPGQSPVSQSITLGLNKSTVIDLQRPASDVVITNAEIADAVVQTRERIIFSGVATGVTNAFIYDDDGNTLLNLEIVVETDYSALNGLIAKHMPDVRVAVEGVNGNVMLTGFVDSVSQSEQVIQLVKLYAGEQVPIANMLNIAAKDQVLLEVRVVEMQRTFLKRLGLNSNVDVGFGDLASLAPDADGSLSIPTLPFSNSSSGSFTPTTPTDGGLSTTLGYTNFVGDQQQSASSLTIQALERVGIARTLAEPNITAVSGETANFLAGGEFPVPTPADETGRVGVTFKQFGVGLGFTPVVLSEDRISLKVATEVSELTDEGSVQGVPALNVRKVTSTVELPSGGSMMLAGLIQTRSRQELESIPGIKDVPVLGRLFSSRDYQNSETELVVIITPYLVDPTAKQDLKTPADGLAYASDSRTLLFGKLNRMYGEDGAPIEPDEYRGPVGFIEEQE